MLSLPAPRTLVSERLFVLAPDLVVALEQHRRARGSDDITERFDAFLLDPGLGPATYLTRDGRIVWYDDMWGIVGTRGEALIAVRVGARKSGIAGLEDLLPVRRTDASDCAHCVATGQFDADGQMRDYEGRPFWIVCAECAGLGWRSPTLDLNEAVLPTG